MNKFRLKLFEDGVRLVYSYRPENKGDWGEVTYTFKDGEVQITKRASENSLQHDNHAVTKILSIAKEKKEFPREFTQAWG